MPRPGSQVIPTGWEAHHSPVAEAVMTAACVITRLTSTVPVPYDQGTGRSTYSTPPTIYSGACRVQRSARIGMVGQVGETPTTVRRYMVGIPLAADPIQVNDLVTVTDATDSALVGLRLRVTDVTGGSLVWERDLLAEVHEPTTR